VDIAYLHRSSRQGYKAGALQEGLKVAQGELVAVFDADFVPSPSSCGARSTFLPTSGSAWCRSAGSISTASTRT